MWDNGWDDYSFLSDLYEPYASVIEQCSDSGEPIVLVDNVITQTDAIDRFNETTDAELNGELPSTTAGCGCTNGTLPAPPWMTVFLLLGLTCRSGQSPAKT